MLRQCQLRRRRHCTQCVRTPGRHCLWMAAPVTLRWVTAVAPADPAQQRHKLDNGCRLLPLLCRGPLASCGLQVLGQEPVATKCAADRLYQRCGRASRSTMPTVLCTTCSKPPMIPSRCGPNTSRQACVLCLPGPCLGLPKHQGCHRLSLQCTNKHKPVRHAAKC